MQRPERSCSPTCDVQSATSRSAMLGADRRSVGVHLRRMRECLRRHHRGGLPATRCGSSRQGETNGAWSLVELTEMPWTNMTWHRDSFDQAYYIREGVFTVK